MSAARAWFTLKPFGFFDRIPALDVRPGTTGHRGL
jgi:Cu2+-containing amine oxidase